MTEIGQPKAVDVVNLRSRVLTAEDPAWVKDQRDAAEAVLTWARKRRAKIPKREELARFIVDASRHIGVLLEGRTPPRGLLTTGELRVCRRLADLSSADLAEMLDGMPEVSLGGLIKQVNLRDRLSRIEAIRTRSAGAMASGHVVSAIVADPPWEYGNAATRNAAALQYPTMTLDEIQDLRAQIDPLLHEEGSHLYLWATHVLLREAFDVLKAWGFTHKATLTWVKDTFGMGNYFRSTTEHVLFGTRGDLPTLVNNERTAFYGKAHGHSAKPVEMFQMVERCSPGPWLEMFARQHRPGWLQWGLESSGNAVLE